MRQATRSIAATLGSLDLVLLNADIFAAMSAWNFSASTAARSMEVNCQGVVHGIDAALPLMLARGRAISRSSVRLPAIVDCHRPPPTGQARRP
jgi:NAD(P)-dependent dehydrogenase (short-subunit alcohol dehydrogenase family)